MACDEVEPASKKPRTENIPAPSPLPAASPATGNNKVFGGDSADAAKDLYDNWAKKYDADLESWGWTSPRRVAEFLGELGCGPLQHVLDAGCGTGLSGAALKVAGIGSEGGIVGIDISQASLDIANAKGVYATTVCGNLEEPFALDAATFDAVVCSGVSSYIRHFDKFLFEVCRVLRSGGVFVMTHRYDFWDTDEHKCRSTITAMADKNAWSIERIGEPEFHMPNNPDPVHSSKRIRLLAFRKS
mmetsp:Transcript_54066/g.97129  ORF Transcript_54066/g.97129 Transcript_54066/m.97129 type:complete len:244 (+) Transcript_54066:52-783(+)